MDCQRSCADTGGKSDTGQASILIPIAGNTEQAENQTAVQTGEHSLTLTDHQTIGGKYDVGTTVPLTGIITSGGTIKDVTVELRTTYLGTRSKKKTYSDNVQPGKSQLI